MFAVFSGSGLRQGLQGLEGLGMLRVELSGCRASGFWACRFRFVSRTIDYQIYEKFTSSSF